MSTGNKTYITDSLIRSIQADGLVKVKQERNRAYLLISVLVIMLILTVVSIMVLSTIRTVIPVVSVLDANGHVVKQTVVSKENMMAKDSFVESQVYSFMMYCNTFDPQWRQHYSDLCRLHATEEVASQYDRETSSDNPDNPYYLIGKHGRRYPKITGMTKLDAGTYQVAFQSITEQSGGEQKVAFYTALVRYVFTAKPLALGDRWENPLGFAAVAYRKDQELSRQ